MIWIAYLVIPSDQGRTSTPRSVDVICIPLRRKKFPRLVFYSIYHLPYIRLFKESTLCVIEIVIEVFRCCHNVHLSCPMAFLFLR